MHIMSLRWQAMSWRKNRGYVASTSLYRFKCLHLRYSVLELARMWKEMITLLANMSMKRLSICLCLVIS